MNTITRYRDLLTTLTGAAVLVTWSYVAITLIILVQGG